MSYPKKTKYSPSWSTKKGSRSIFGSDSTRNPIFKALQEHQKDMWANKCPSLTPSTIKEPKKCSNSPKMTQKAYIASTCPQTNPIFSYMQGCLMNESSDWLIRRISCFHFCIQNLILIPCFIIHHEMNINYNKDMQNTMELNLITYLVNNIIYVIKVQKYLLVDDCFPFLYCLV